MLVIQQFNVSGYFPERLLKTQVDNPNQIKIMNQINYIDFITGSGKTQSFISEAKSNKSKILVYAASSALLLSQTYADLLNSGIDRDRIHIVYQKVIKIKNEICNRGVVPPSRGILNLPVQDLSNLLNGSASFSRQTLDGTYKDVKIETLPGDIILTTHKAVARLDMQNEGFEFGSITHVFFDEAVDIAQESASITMRVEEWEKFRDTFCVPLPVDNVYMVKENSTTLNAWSIKKALGVKVLDAEAKKILTMWKRCGKRYKLVVEQHKKKGKLTMLLEPADMFKAFKEVTIMCAGFKNSLMYHALMQDGCKPESVNHRYPELQKAHNSILKNMFARVRGVFLISEENGKAVNGLTAYRMTNSMLVPNNLESKMVGSTYKQIMEAVSGGNDLAAYAEPPLNILSKKASNIQKKFKANKMLTIANKEVGKTWLSGVGFNIKRKGMLVPETPKLNGENQYRKLNAFCYLAGMNRGNGYREVYENRYSGYNAYMDSVIENLFQCMFRVSLRDRNASDPVLVILPYKRMFQDIADYLGVENEFRIVNKNPFYKWYESAGLTKESKSRDTSIATKASVLSRAVWHPKFKELYKKEINTVQSAISRSKRLLNNENLQKWELKKDLLLAHQELWLKQS